MPKPFLDRREISYWFDGAQRKVMWKTANSLFVSASVSQYPWADVKRPSVLVYLMIIMNISKAPTLRLKHNRTQLTYNETETVINLANS